MTKYPQWQESIRKAQQEKQAKLEQEQAEQAEAARIEAQAEQTALSSLLASLDIPTNLPYIKGNERGYVVGNYRFTVWSDEGEYSLRVLPYLSDEDEALFEKTEVNLTFTTNWSYPYQFWLAPTFETYRDKLRGHSTIKAYRPVSQGQDNTEGLKAWIAEEIDRIDEALPKAKEKALHIDQLQKNGFRPVTEKKAPAPPESASDKLLEAIRQIISIEIQEAFADREGY